MYFVVLLSNWFSWINALGAPPFFILFAVSLRNLFRLTKSLRDSKTKEDRERNAWIWCVLSHSVLICLEFWSIGWIGF